MCDPEVVDGGALDYHEIHDEYFPNQQIGTGTLGLKDAIEFDLEVAAWGP